MSRKILPRKELELFLESIESHPHPKASLEQYTIPADVASEILHIAAFQHHDILGKDVAELGAGTGRLALGAAYLGAGSVTGVEIDRDALVVARRRGIAFQLNNRVQWILGDIGAVVGIFDTVLQNPPFGVRRRGADRRFIEKALDIGNVIYTLHKSSAASRDFIKKLVQSHGGTISGTYQMRFAIPQMFQFHRKRRHMVKVDLFRVISHGRKR